MVQVFIPLHNLTLAHGPTEFTPGNRTKKDYQYQDSISDEVLAALSIVCIHYRNANMAEGKQQYKQYK